METWGILAVHRTIVAVDVEEFGDQHRTNRNQLAVRDGLYRLMRETLRDAEIRWVDGDHEDRGDGIFILVGSVVPKSLFVESLPSALVRALWLHNAAHSDLERIRLWMVLRAGEVYHGMHRAVASSINMMDYLWQFPLAAARGAGTSWVFAIAAAVWRGKLSQHIYSRNRTG